MAVIQAENIGDIVATTLKELGKPKFTDISSPLQKHVAFQELLDENRVVIESGYAIQFDVSVLQSNAARTVSLGQSDVINQVDGMVQASTVWRNVQTSYMLIGQLVEMNAEPARIVDFVRYQRIQALISLAELMEQLFWSAPSATDQLTPYGLPYAITKNATKGFNGGSLTGFTTKYGLSNTSYPMWANWTAPFSNITIDDFVRQAREACTKTDWVPPVSGIPSPNTGDKWGMYTNYPVLQALQEAVMSGNNDLGPDLDKYDGPSGVMLRRTPVEWIPWLDRDTTNPYYGINWGWYKTYVLRKWWMRETNVPITPGQHTVASHFIDSTLQWVHKNPRTGFVLSNGTSYPS